MAEIVLKGVSKSFGNQRVIENLDLRFEDGQFTVLVGPSGCGKTTLLRMIAGIGPQTSGQIFLDGQDISNTPPGERDVAMVFQNYAIYPTMNVQENIEFGLKNRRMPEAERLELVEEYTKIVGLYDYLHRMPDELSGGQRQRIALARAMVKKPRVFLMDEPLSNLDAKLRAAMRVELSELQSRLKATFIYVTHDQIEAMSMADKIILMHQGQIMQIASPEEIYHHPENVFTAEFIGTPPMNLFPLTDQGSFGIRPEKVGIVDPGRSASEEVYTGLGVIKNREMLGSETLYNVYLEGLQNGADNSSKGSIMIKSPDERFREQERVRLELPTREIHYFDREGLACQAPAPLPQNLGGCFELA